MLPRSVTAYAPSTVANVGVGFDVLGFAVDSPGDTVEARRHQGSGIILREITGDRGRLPYGENNTAVAAATSLLEHLGKPFGVELYLHKGMPLASGLGSSAASAVATLTAINCLAGNPVQKNDLLRFAIKSELVASGAAHADNAAPSLLGGFVLIRSTEPIDLVSLPVPTDLAVALLSPNVEIPTTAARQILRKQIPLTAAIRQWGNLGSLIASLYSENYDLMGRSLCDVIAEPIRAVLIPGFKQVKKAALDSGAIGCSISGAGPAVFALTKTKEMADKVGQEMKISFAKAGLEADKYVSRINRLGSYVVKKC